MTGPGLFRSGFRRENIRWTIGAPAESVPNMSRIQLGRFANAESRARAQSERSLDISALILPSLSEDGSKLAIFAFTRSAHKPRTPPVHKKVPSLEPDRGICPRRQTSVRPERIDWNSVSSSCASEKALRNLRIIRFIRAKNTWSPEFSVAFFSDAFSSFLSESRRITGRRSVFPQGVQGLMGPLTSPVPLFPCSPVAKLHRK